MKTWSLSSQDYDYWSKPMAPWASGAANGEGEKFSAQSTTDLKLGTSDRLPKIWDHLKKSLSPTNYFKGAYDKVLIWPTSLLVTTNVRSQPLRHSLALQYLCSLCVFIMVHLFTTGSLLLFHRFNNNLQQFQFTTLILGLNPEGVQWKKL